MPDSTGEKIEHLKIIIEEANAEIKDLQDACKHYWELTYSGINDVEYTCMICGKKKYEEI